MYVHFYNKWTPSSIVLYLFYVRTVYLYGIAYRTKQNAIFIEIIFEGESKNEINCLVEPVLVV